MAETENKNQHTLYRFVSLRNPELTKKENKTKRFVFHPDNKTGVFFNGMSSSIETKWQNLTNTSSTFSTNAIQSVEDLEMLINKNFFEFANWLSSNRTKFDSKLALKTISELKNLELKTELLLWDNLFYQVITQKDFYIKENIMHLLVLNNLLKEINALATEIEKLDYISILAQARVVLPTILFEEKATIKSNPSAKSSEENVPTLDEVQSTNRNTANTNIKLLESAQKEILKLEKIYNKEFTKASQKANSEYQDKIKPIIDKFQSDWNTEQRKLCSVPRPDNYNPNDICNIANIKYPDLPKFEFEFPQKTDAVTLKNELSEESYIVLETINALKNNDSYSEISEKIQDAIQNEQKTVIENTNYSTPVLLVNGITISLKENNKTFARGENKGLNPAFVPERFGVRNIGIADYKKVVSHVCCYDAGEVSHIENIMAKELRSKTTTRERIEEFTETSETQQEKENLSDTSSTDRFEMQTEVSKLLAEQKQTSASANFHAGWGAVGTEYTLDAGANYATNSSKEESNRQAVTQAKDVTNRAMERIVTKVRHETIKKTTDRFKEENIHAFDNTQGENHVSGVYRFINSIYKNQIYNYGKRMMYEFMIPQPSKLHKLGMIENTDNLNAIKLLKPLDPRENGLPDPDCVDNTTAMFWASRLGIEIKQLPDEFIFTGKSFSNANSARNIPTAINGTISIPERYISIEAKIYATGSGQGSAGDFWGNSWTANLGPTPLNGADNAFYPINNYSNEVPITIGIIGYHLLNVTITVKCQLTNSAKATWRNETFNTIIKAYEIKKQEYLDSLSNNQATRESNPGFYRQIEQLVLRKNCISYLMDETKMGQGFYSGNALNNYAINQTQDMDNYASMSKFMEQAFEWNLISYNFYPFYWRERTEWNELYQYECNDPLFRNFMQSGMARVVVTVKPGFENAVLHYMATGQIWNGGEIPVLGNPLYLSIVDEIKEQEYVIEETWETVVPTSLVALQSSGVAIDAGGLPCGTDCIDHAGNNFKVNDATLGKKIIEPVLPTR